MHMNNGSDRRIDGWPADERPIFIDTGFGQVDRAVRDSDRVVPRPLGEGTILPTDASPAEFANAWSDVLAERPSDPDRWEYAVETSLRGDPSAFVPLLLPEALEQVRRSPGARLQRRPVGHWRRVTTPFPSVKRVGWGDLEPLKSSWYAAMNEFAPSFRGTASRMGGIEGIPADWVEFAHRATAAGFTPDTYRLLGTALAAWEQRGGLDRLGRKSHTPGIEHIELWARFPQLVETHSLLNAVHAAWSDIR